MNILKQRKRKWYNLIILLIFLFILSAGIFTWQTYGQKIESKELEERNPKEDNIEQGQNTEAFHNNKQIKEDQAVLEIQNKIEQKIAGMSLEEKVAQLFVITPEALTNIEEVTTDLEIIKSSLKKYPGIFDELPICGSCMIGSFCCLKLGSLS